MTDSSFIVERVSVVAEKPFDEVAKGLARELGRFDPGVYASIAESRDPESARARIQAMAGPGMSAVVALSGRSAARGNAVAASTILDFKGRLAMPSSRRALAQSNVDQGPEHGPIGSDLRTAVHFGRRVADAAALFGPARFSPSGA